MADYYKTIVVGSDGSKSSLLAVERAAKIAAAFDSTLIIGTAYYRNEEEAAKTLRQDSVTISATTRRWRTSRAQLSTPAPQAHRTCRPQPARALRSRR